MAKLGRAVTAFADRGIAALLARLPGHATPARLRVTALAARWSPSVTIDRTARSAAVSRDPRGPDVVTRLLTRGEMGIEELRSDLADGRDFHIGDPVPRHLLSLAWLLTVQHRGDLDYRTAIALFERASTSIPVNRWGTRFTSAYVSALLAVRNYEVASRIISTMPRSIEREMLAIDASAAGGAPDPGLLSRIWESRGHAPVRLISGRSSAFDRLDVPPSGHPPLSGVLVTVVVSAYRPGPELVTAVKSVAAQTWATLQILVVDDASGPEYREIFGAVRAMDPRVVIHRMEANGGTYTIRNWALDHAQGEFITFHDADDWMHPERIALQAQHLQDNPGVLHNASWGTRVTESLAFSHTRKLGPAISEPSLMLRRTEVLDLVGYFDGVRKGADNEFRLRLETATASPTVVLGSAPLTLERLMANSLSSGDIVGRWFAPPRRVYRSCSDAWHRRSKSLRLAAMGGRPFYAPPFMTSGPEPHVDVVVVSNWLEQGTWNRDCPAAARIVRGLARAGLRVGIADEPSLMPIADMQAGLSRKTAELLNSGAVEFVSLEAPRDRLVPLLIAPQGSESAQGLQRAALEVRTFIPGRRYGSRQVTRNAIVDIHRGVKSSAWTRDSGR